MDENKDIVTTNIASEMCLVGSFYKNPDLYVNYGTFMRSKYDISDDVIKFFYDSFETYYLTFSQTVDETKVNTFMAQNSERLRMYKKHKGWNTIKRYMKLADDSDIENYFNVVKKYSLIREYEKNGYPVDKLVSHKNFEKMNANDIYRVIRAKADKINTVINAGQEAVDLADNMSSCIQGFLIKPDRGVELPWHWLDEMFRGCRLGKVVFNGFLSNEGKSRNLMLLCAYLTLIKEKKFLLLSNEMDEEDLKSCLITTVVNNECFHKVHGIKMKKCEKEIVLGAYRDRSGNIIRRKIDENGKYIESEKEYIDRVKNTSDEFNNIMKISNWIETKRKGKLFFKDVGSDYSDSTLEFEFRKAKMVHNIEYCGYDTMKGYRTDEWSSVKQTATKIKELMKELKMFCWSVFQLTDETVFTDVFALSSNNIANAKQMKHVVDALLLGKRIAKDDYKNYRYIETNHMGETTPTDLDERKTYFAIKVDKNRGGNKDYIPLFEINLDYNTWDEIGYLVKKA